MSIKFHGNPSSSCSEISLWTQAVDRVADRPTLPSLLACLKISITTSSTLMFASLTLQSFVDQNPSGLLGSFIHLYFFGSLFWFSRLPALSWELLRAGDVNLHCALNTNLL